MNSLQLEPSIPVEVEGYGLGEARIMLDYGPDKELFWVVFLDEDGRSIIAPNTKIKKSNN